MSILDRLFGRKEKSSSVAKDRLQLVLVHDRVDLAPGKMNLMKDELIQVISKYVDIDQGGIEIAITRENNQNLLIANIPLVGARQK